MIRIVTNKKLDMTNDEFTLYQKIVDSYTQEPYQRGEDLFLDLFETNEDGVIVFLKPPSTRRTSMEVFLFLVSLMTQQHIRIMYKMVNEACQSVNK